ncbi:MULTISPECIES: hypothetical protein [Roseobacteraceae]|uniref:Uncharacterized protein n=1 Tax=Celeribacter baekdonensis B30 TaxID=1208323 RepID=K2J4U8_9RHOB|nr:MULTISPECIES: hypothetical protein [Roseobacteraceae]EKE69947.1 hypothetical protein B30_13709 [Celeribacter baekdonensis B30]KAB6717838.1 hypothetical protein C8029_01405 [Roseobacter sp. TSBP12]|tara:strand:- start:4423 stop:4758 length:336 start_codon:yes stop_codon:yes gene_type:complete
MDFDFQSLQADTVAVFQKIDAEYGIPGRAKIDYALVPNGEAADWQACEDALRRAGYTVKRFEGEGYLTATTQPLSMSLETVWLHEEEVTLLALQFGFSPDGWGFTGLSPTS